MWERLFCYHDGVRIVIYNLTQRGFSVSSWDGIFYDSYVKVPLTHATHAGIVAQLFGINLTPTP